MKIQIKQVDGAWCKVDLPTRKLIEPCLAYKYTWYKKGKYAKKAMPSTGYLMDRKANEFLVGLLPRISSYLAEKNHTIELIKDSYVQELDDFKLRKVPKVQGIIFRPDQLKLIKAAATKKRGVIKAPTGSGKTVLIMGLISLFPARARTLILVHNVSIVKQTLSELKKKGFNNVQQVGGKGDVHVDQNAQIVVATLKTYNKLIRDNDWLDDWFWLVVVDEAHHCADLKSQYGEAMSTNQASYKIGFTATLPDQLYRQLSLEALIGPQIGELTVDEAINKGIIAEPIIQLIPVPYEAHIGELYKYRDIYTMGIVYNTARNSLIIDEAERLNRKGRTALVMVKELDQGQELLREGQERKMNIVFLQGASPAKAREQVRLVFNRKEIKTVIATAVWKEGIDIPTLDCVINACGGKSEIQTLQALGRGLRVTEEKSTVEIIDFLDPYRYLARHTVMRLQTYVKNRWL